MKSLAFKFLFCFVFLFSGLAQAGQVSGEIPNTEFEYSITYSRTLGSKLMDAPFLFMFHSREIQHLKNTYTAYEVTLVIKTPDGEFSFPKTKVVAGEKKVYASVKFKGTTYRWKGKVDRLFSERSGKDIFEWTLLEKDKDGEKSTVFGPLENTFYSYKLKKLFESFTN